MDNIITYAETALDSFDARPFSDVDSLILSCVAYLDLPRELSDAHSWKGLPLRELFRAEHFDRLFSVTFAKISPRRAHSSPRRPFSMVSSAPVGKWV